MMSTGQLIGRKNRPTGGGTITVTKRGRPVATVSAAKKPVWKSPKNLLAGQGKIVGDIVNFTTAHLWEALRRDEEAE